MTVKVTIDGDGLNYNGETNLHKAGQIIGFLGVEQTNLNPTSAVQQTLSTKSMMGLSTSSTPRQLIDQSGAKTNPQKIAVIARYLKERGQDVFTRSELVQNFRRAGEASPKNIGRDLKDAVILDYICESLDQRDEYYLTNNGDIQVSQGFSEGKTGKPVRSKSKKTKASSIEPSNQKLKDITFVPKVEGLPSYWDISKGERILWILQVAKSNSISSLSNKDIEYVAKTLDDNIPNSNVNAFSKSSKKNGHLTRVGTVYTILGPGITYLKSLLTANKDENK